MSGKRVIAVTGTPGTGKSTISRKISAEWGCELVDLNSLIEEKNIYDTDRDGTKVVDPEELEGIVWDRISETNRDVVLDGHLSHLLSSDLITDIIVLRTNPKTLRERLKNRGYSGNKLQENVEAETIGVIVGEILDLHGSERVYEIDTTQTDPDSVLEKLDEAFENNNFLEPDPIDWLEDYDNLNMEILDPPSEKGS